MTEYGVVWSGRVKSLKPLVTAALRGFEQPKNYLYVTTRHGFATRRPTIPADMDSQTSLFDYAWNRNDPAHNQAERTKA